MDLKGIVSMLSFMIIQVMYFHLNGLEVPYQITPRTSNKYDLLV